MNEKGFSSINRHFSLFLKECAGNFLVTGYFAIATSSQGVARLVVKQFVDTSL